MLFRAGGNKVSGVETIWPKLYPNHRENTWTGLKYFAYIICCFILFRLLFLIISNTKFGQKTMAFKRSAVRSCLSPPLQTKTVEIERFRRFFLYFRTFWRCLRSAVSAGWEPPGGYFCPTRTVTRNISDMITHILFLPLICLYWSKTTCSNNAKYSKAQEWITSFLCFVFIRWCLAFLTGFGPH